MRKRIISGIILAISLAMSYGQGVIIFDTYICNDGVGAFTSIFGSPPYTGVGSAYTAELIWASGTVADPVNYSDPSSISSFASGSFSPATGSFKATYGINVFPGEFMNGVAVLPGYTGGSVTFEILSYNGNSYANSSMRGRSGSFTMASVQISPSPADVMTGVPDFYVAAIPEPSTLGLLSLGGLLLGWRGRKSSRL